MVGAPGDRDWYIARDPRTPPAHLADLAARRSDLHGVIAANPNAYPALRQWIASVNSTPQAYRPASSAGAGAPFRQPQQPRRRRSGAAWGCLTSIVVVLVILVGIAALVPDGDDAADGTATTDGGGSAPTSDVSRDPAVAEQLEIFESESEQFYALYAQIEHNPVAPLVADLGGFMRLEEYATQQYATVSTVQNATAEAIERRQELENRITAAEGDRTNDSGTHAEALIDDAGDGFIRVDWEADTACDPTDRPGWVTSACVYPEDPLLVHLLDESAYVNEWQVNMVVVHELAHVYQSADTARSARVIGEFRELLEQGLFQGEVESMADCFALTYFDEWTLDNGVEVGYGYVCNESERAAIREWAADLGVVMPG